MCNFWFQEAASLFGVDSAQYPIARVTELNGTRCSNETATGPVSGDFGPLAGRACDCGWIVRAPPGAYHETGLVPARVYRPGTVWVEQEERPDQTGIWPGRGVTPTR